MSKKLVEVVLQGSVIVNSCTLLHDSEVAKILCLDLKTKHAEITDYDANGVVLHPTEQSTGVGEFEGMTLVKFQEFDGFDVVATSCMRYTCYITLLAKMVKPIRIVTL